MTPHCISVGLALALVAHGLPAPAQFPPAEDPPAEHKPTRPPTREALARREARVLYGLAVLRQQNDRLLEAVKLFEQARSLDAKAAPVHRGLMTLYAALGRSDDALAACRAALDLDPGDHETWYSYARQLRLRGRFPEARDALRRAAACPSLAEHPDTYVQAHYDLSTLHEDLQEYDQAVAALTVVLRVLESPEKLRELETPPDPARLAEQAASMYERIIRLWIQAGRHPEAVAAFKQAVAKHAVLATRLNLQMARVQTAQGQLAEALLRLDDHLRTQPVSTEGYELKAAVLEKLGRGAEVLPMLDAYARRDPHNLALQLLLGRQYARAGPFEQAEKFYQDLLDKHEAAPDVYRGLFALYREEGRPEKAFHTLNLTLLTQNALWGDARAAARGRAMLAVLREDAELGKALVPAAVAQLDRGGLLHADTAFFLAVLAARGKQLPAAERLYRHCLETAPDPQREVAVYDGLLRVLWASRKYDGVVWLCERGLRQAAGANRLLFHVNLARALALQGKAAEALAEADRAVAAALDDDTRFAARLARLRVLWHVERQQAALAECQALLKERLQPAQARDVRQLLSGIYSTLKDYPRAEEQLQLVLKDDPNDATACNDLGYLWADQGKNLEEAERLIRKALDLDREQKKAVGDASGAAEPDNAAFLDSLGWVLFRKGDAAGARANLEKAATLPDGAEDPVVWDHLGDVYSWGGDAARAGAAYRRALDLYEKDGRRKADNRGPEIRRKLQQLGE